MEWTGVPHHEMRYHIGLIARLGGVDRVDASAPGYKRQHTGGTTPIQGVTMRHMRGEEQQDGLDVFNLTRLQQNFRKEIWEDTEALKRKPGYQDVFLLDTASQLGVRVTRVLDAQHVLTLEESMTHAVFPDAIGMSGASDPIPFRGATVPTKKRPCWQIPYRSLLPRGCDNLWVAGRCFGFEDGLAWDAREIGTCFVTGQAAGTAAGMAVTARCAASEVDITRLQTELKQRGVIL
jgi:hypothetical protein